MVICCAINTGNSWAKHQKEAKQIEEEWQIPNIHHSRFLCRHVWIRPLSHLNMYENIDTKPSNHPTIKTNKTRPGGRTWPFGSAVYKLQLHICVVNLQAWVTIYIYICQKNARPHMKCPDEMFRCFFFSKKNKLLSY